MQKSENVPSKNVPPETTRVTRTLRRLVGAMRDRNGQPPTYRDLEEWTGFVESTLKGWFSNTGNPTAELLFQLLERVPEKIRNQVVNEVCRCWPSLEYPRLKADQTLLSRLKTAIRQTSGLIAVQGGSDESRTFVCSALANTFLALTERPRRVRGIDVHAPDWFVPVPGVTYLNNLFHSVALQVEVNHLWPSLYVGRSSLVLLNGVWSKVPEFQTRILALAHEHPVIIADEISRKALRFRRKTTVFNHLITVADEPETRSISVKITTI